MHPGAALYTLQIALGMLIWSSMDERGSGLINGLLVATPFFALAIVLFRSSGRFIGDVSLDNEPVQLKREQFNEKSE